MNKTFQLKLTENLKKIFAQLDKERVLNVIGYLKEKFKKYITMFQDKAIYYMEKMNRNFPTGEDMYGDEWTVGKNPKRYTHWILWVSFLFVIIFILWAKFAKLDELTIAEGKVIPSSQIQVIQNLEGGIIQKIYVKEGDYVQKSQLLIQLEPARFKAAYEEGLIKDIALEFRVARLTAEVDLKPFAPPPSLIKSEPQMFKHELQLHTARRQQLSQLYDSRQLAQSEVDLTAPLIKTGAASPIEVLNLKKNVSEIQERINSFNSDTLNQLTQTRADLNAIKEVNMGYLDRLQRTAMRSPVKGIVKQIKVTTVGGVSQPGADLMEIVPIDDTLLVEAKVKPSDIGFLRPGLPATVKIGAYDYSIYGGLQGKVEQISADSIIDDKDSKQQSYYLIRVRTHKNYLGTAKKPLYIIPGMTSTVDVLTGQKSVLNYLLKPLIKARERALRER
jgi:adhesin transport system membrane fusion protein